MKKIAVILALVSVLGVAACDSKPANSSYHNSSNDVRQDNKNANANVNGNVNANANVVRK